MSSYSHGSALTVPSWTSPWPRQSSSGSQSSGRGRTLIGAVADQAEGASASATSSISHACRSAAY